MLKKLFLYGLIVYSIFGFLILPLILEPLVQKIVSEKTYAKLSLGSISFNPFTFEITIDGIVLKTLEDEKVVALERLEVDLEPHSLIYTALHVKSMKLNKPELFVVYNKDKTLNFMKIIKKKEEDNKATPRLIFDSVKVVNGTLNYEDYTKRTKFELHATDFDFKLSNVDTNDFNKSDASFGFNTTLSDGALVDFRSNIRGFKPLVIDGSLNLGGSKLYTGWKYIQDNIGAEVADGIISLGAKYYLNMDDLNSAKVDDIHLDIKGLRLKPKDKTADILNLKSFKIDDMSVKPLAKTMYIKAILLDSLSAKVIRSADGEFDLRDYLKFKQNNPSNHIEVSQNGVQNKTTWSVAIEDFSAIKIGATLKDESVAPIVNTKLNELNFSAKNITLLGEKPLSYALDLTLNDTFKCGSSGDIKYKKLEINSYMRCRDLDFSKFLPYIDKAASSGLKTYNVLLKKGVVDFDFNATVRDENSKIGTLIRDANLSLRDFELKRRDRDEKLLSFGSIAASGVSFMTQTKSIAVEKIAVGALAIFAKKDKYGALNFNGLIEAKEQNSSEIERSQKPYDLKLGALNLNLAKVTFVDESIKNSSTTIVDKIDLALKNIPSGEKNRLDYQLSSRVNGDGTLSSKGEFKYAPFEQRGIFEVKKVSLKEFTPYLQESTFLKISDGYLNANGKSIFKSIDKKPDISLFGALSVDELLLQDSRDNSSIVSLAKADVKSFNFKTFPNSLYIDELDLNSFYADVIIDKNKALNLSKLTRPKEEVQKDSNQTQIQVQSNNLAFKLAKLKISNGSANFADYSLPIKFKTSIHDLNGGINGISNRKGETSYVDIVGEVDRYGSTKLKGSLDSADAKSFMDLDFNFRNLDLSSASGYSAQFAGYKIAKGNLFLDLKYKIINSQLLGKNSVIIKNIELGEPIDDKNITKLPLSFAIALLEDSDGVININLPIEGNIDAPDFKYGAIIKSVLKNIILKAVASPFKFLGSMFGISGDKLKYIEFESGEGVLIPSEREKLDNLWDFLSKKPKIQLVVEGSFDSKRDYRAIQIQKLKKTIMRLSKQEYYTSEILEKIYLLLDSKNSVKSLKNDLKNRVDADREYQKELFERCVNAQIVLPEELKALALKRAKAIEDYLVLTKGYDSKKVLLHEVKEISENDGDYVNTELKIEMR